MTARVGGMWDAMLAEGRPWWVTANSDVHQVFNDTLKPGTQDYHATGSRGAPIDSGVKQTTYSDFFPGQYGANVVGARSKSYVDIMRGLQSGKVVAVHGGLIDGLEVRVRSRDDLRGVTLGGRTFIRRGGDVEVTIEIDRADGPNFSGSVPVLAKVDLIAGPVTGPASDRDLFVAPGTSVVKTFEVPRRGKIRFSHTFAGSRAVVLPAVAGQRRQSAHLGRGSDGRRGRELGPVVGPVVLRESGVRRRHLTPRGRNCTLIRGPTAFAVFGTACSHVRWHEPPITSRSPCPSAYLCVSPPPRGRSSRARGVPTDRMATIVSSVAPRPIVSPCHATLSRPSR